MALSLKDAKSHLSPKAYAQVQKQVDNGGAGKNQRRSPQRRLTLLKKACISY